MYNQGSLHTFRRAIRRGNNNNTVLKEILKKLLENHGIGDISDLKREKNQNVLSV